MASSPHRTPRCPWEYIDDGLKFLASSLFKHNCVPNSLKVSISPSLALTLEEIDKLEGRGSSKL